MSRSGGESKTARDNGERPDGTRVIITKSGKMYELAADEVGVPVEEYFRGMAANLPRPLVGAKVYQTVDGPVLVFRMDQILTGPDSLE